MASEVLAPPVISESLTEEPIHIESWRRVIVRWRELGVNGSMVGSFN